jgi:alkylation response protein AidB-like acyl-CoA dehydrogenase
MDFRFTPEQDAFRGEVRAFLEQELSGRERGDDEGVSREFSKKLSARGWIGRAWPAEYGGAGLTSLEQMIYTEEMTTYEAPVGYHFTGERQVGPSLILHGTEDQRREYLPKIVNADISFCLGLSEPGAGSDLAAVATRAVRDGDDYVVNGQKIWTSNAHRADMIWLVTRTNPDVPKHKGISLLMVDMKSPGISVRPLVNLAGRHNFNEVFFEDVRVPARNRVGEENSGWYLLAEHLDFERSGIERLVSARKLLQQLTEHVRAWPGGHPRRTQAKALLSELWIELEVGRLMCYRVAWLQSQGRVPNYEASLSKAFGSEWVQRVANSAVKLAGMASIAAPGDGGFQSAVQRQYLGSVATTIQAGTSEIQRNIIATRGLGLPRS